jgi:putative molybdopterin biosynthesis protein
MNRPMTISQIGRVLGKPPSWVRHHVKVLEFAGLISIDKIQVTEGYIEKYYQANAKALLIRQLVLSEYSREKTLIGIGSNDIALERILEVHRRKTGTSSIDYISDGSLNGLIALRQGIAQFTGCHLFDPVSKEYNRTFVQHLFPGKSLKLITFAHRTQGIIILPGNPKQVKDLFDFLRSDITIINRNQGSGTRIWLDQQIKSLGISQNQIQGYKNEVNEHAELVNAILRGIADAGIGVQAAAVASGLDFQPLFTERFDLVIDSDMFNTPSFIQLLDTLSDEKSNRNFYALPGYDTRQTGTIIDL